MLSSSEKRRQRQQRPGASQPLLGSVQGEGFFLCYWLSRNYILLLRVSQLSLHLFSYNALALCCPTHTELSAHFLPLLLSLGRRGDQNGFLKALKALIWHAIVAILSKCITLLEILACVCIPRTEKWKLF